RREQDDGQLARLTVSLERARELQTTHVRKHPVDEHEIRPLIDQRSPRGTAILRLTYLESGTLQTERDHLADRLLILDDQDLFGGHDVRDCMAGVLHWASVADS